MDGALNPPSNGYILLVYNSFLSYKTMPIRISLRAVLLSVVAVRVNWVELETAASKVNFRIPGLLCLRIWKEDRNITIFAEATDGKLQISYTPGELEHKAE